MSPSATQPTTSVRPVTPQMPPRALPTPGWVSPWLQIGVGIKRWVLLIALGVLFVAVGASQVVSWARVFQIVSRISSFHAGLIAAGGLSVLVGVFFLMKSVTTALVPARTPDIGHLIYQNRLRQRGPRIVVVGGGTGLSSLLKGIKGYTTNITAVVTVSDDGGSSGRLIKDFEVPPPGDIRNCLVALAQNEAVLGPLFQYRFDKGGGLAGHSFGNLLITALTEVSGDFMLAIEEVSKVLAIVGEVLPSTCQRVVLKAKFDDGNWVEGESRISAYGKKITRIHLDPVAVQPPPQVLDRLARADCIVIGPGSLYTSLIPNLLVDGIVEAINRSSAPVVFVGNIMTQPGETDNYTHANHLEAICRHTNLERIDSVLCNSQILDPVRLVPYASQGSIPVPADTHLDIRDLVGKVDSHELVSDSGLIRHDSNKLAMAIMRIIEKRMVSRVKILTPRK